MQRTADASESESDSKRTRFRNLIHLIRLTSTILHKGKGPQLQSEEKVPSPYTSNPTYLDAAARLLVRKDEVIAAVKCASPCEFAVTMSQPSVTVWNDNPLSSLNLGELPGTYITNPEDKPQILYQSSKRSQVTLWDNIKRNEWHYLSLPLGKSNSKVAPRVHLSKHLATIESYLEYYRALRSDSDTDRAARQSNRDKFQKYILTSCFMKMHTRTEHWISIGIITSINSISEPSLIAAVEDMNDPFVRVDPDLTKYLKGGQDSYIAEIMQYHTRCMKGGLDDNDDGFSVDPIVNVETLNHDKHGEVYIYTSAIAVAFHRLLVSSLLSYVFRLRMVCKAVKALPDEPSSGPPEVVVIAFMQLLISAQLLFVLSHSRLLLFEKHSKLISCLFLIPMEIHVGIYTQNFEDITKLHANHVNVKILEDSISALNGPPSQPPEFVQASAIDALAAEESATEESDAGTTDEVLDSAPDVESVYRRWIMGMVDHFASIRVLERVSGKLPPEAKINFSILGMNRPSLPSCSWATMVGEIQTLCQDSFLVSKASETRLPPDLANKAIEIIETKINEYKASKSVKNTSARFEATVYQFFKKLLSNSTPESQFTGCNHCEAILMAIIHRIIKKDDLGFSLELGFSRNFTIAVSKSCCPVCWEIITIFNRQNQEQGSSVCFQARGRHPNLYPVDLPDILDEGIKDELLTKFSITLLKDLISLFEQDARAANAKRMRSESNVSQPESVTFGLFSSMDDSTDMGSSQTNQADVAKYFLERMKS